MTATKIKLFLRIWRHQHNLGLEPFHAVLLPAGVEPVSMLVRVHLEDLPDLLRQAAVGGEEGQAMEDHFLEQGEGLEIQNAPVGLHF